MISHYHSRCSRLIFPLHITQYVFVVFTSMPLGTPSFFVSRDISLVVSTCFFYYWLVVWNSRDDSSFPVVRLVLAELESGKFHSFRAMTGFPMDVADFENGKHINIVCTLKVDHTHITHLMTQSNDGCDFHLDGLLNGGLDSHSILGYSLSCQLLMPKAFTDEKTKILSHFTPSWEGMPNLIDLCSGFGGLAHGAIAAGMHVMVAVDQNPKMFALWENP